MFGHVAPCIALAPRPLDDYTTRRLASYLTCALLQDPGSGPRGGSGRLAIGRGGSRSGQATEPVRPSQLDPAAGAAAGLGPRHRAGARRRAVDWHRRGAGALRRHRLHRLPAEPRRPAGSFITALLAARDGADLGRHAGRRLAPQGRPLHATTPRPTASARRRSPTCSSRATAPSGRSAAASSPRSAAAPSSTTAPSRACRPKACARWSRPPTACCWPWALPRSCGSTAQRFHRYANRGELIDGFGAVDDRRSRRRALGRHDAWPGRRRARRPDAPLRRRRRHAGRARARGAGRPRRHAVDWHVERPGQARGRSLRARQRARPADRASRCGICSRIATAACGSAPTAACTGSASSSSRCSGRPKDSRAISRRRCSRTRTARSGLASRTPVCWRVQGGAHGVSSRRRPAERRGLLHPRQRVTAPCWSARAAASRASTRAG